MRKDRKMENKEMQLLTGIGRSIVKYLDYIILLLVFPVIFDVKMFDVKVFIALGTLIVIKAVMPLAYGIVGIDSDLEEVDGNAPLQPQPQPQPQQSQEEKKEEKGGEIKYHAIVDATNMQRNMIRFTGDKHKTPVQINTKKIDGDFILTSFPDFRTIKLHKDEVEQMYIALLESEYGFFKPGKWYLELKVKSQI